MDPDFVFARLIMYFLFVVFNWCRVNCVFLFDYSFFSANLLCSNTRKHTLRTVLLDGTYMQYAKVGKTKGNHCAHISTQHTQFSVQRKRYACHGFSVECVFEVSEPHSCNPQNSLILSIINFLPSISMIYIPLDRELICALSDITVIWNDE